MQTYTLNKNQPDLSEIVRSQTKEPVIIKNENGMSYLLLPFSPDKLQNIFLMIYQSFNQLNEQSEQYSKSSNLSENSKSYEQHIAQLKVKYKDLPIVWGKGKPDISDFAGIWKDKNITLETLREKAWKRN